MHYPANRSFMLYCVYMAIVTMSLSRVSADASVERLGMRINNLCGKHRAAVARLLRLMHSI